MARKGSYLDLLHSTRTGDYSLAEAYLRAPPSLWPFRAEQRLDLQNLYTSIRFAETGKRKAMLAAAVQAANTAIEQVKRFRNRHRTPAVPCNATPKPKPKPKHGMASRDSTLR